MLDCASDCLATKGWSFARTTLVPGAEVDVYNLHNEAGGCDEDIAIREQAAMDLVAAILERSTDRAVIVAGDFNLRYTDPEDVGPLDTIVQGASLRDVCNELQCGQDDEIDHIMVRDGARLRLEPMRWWKPDEFVDEMSGDPLSDHPAVAVELRYVPQ
jgi:endonuclease/exonuclease/phosphatase family metal-dependent hydrolase